MATEIQATVVGESAVAPAKAKSAKAPKEKKSAAAPKKPRAHPPYVEMINEAISTLKERTGSSQIAIAKFIEDRQKDLPPNFKKLLLVQLKKLVASGKLIKIKNSFKLSAPLKVAAAPAAAKNAPGEKKGKVVAVKSKKAGASTPVKSKKKVVVKAKEVEKKPKKVVAKAKEVEKKPKKVAKTAKVTTPGKKKVAAPVKKVKKAPVDKAKKVKKSLVKKVKSLKSPAKKGKK